MRKFVSIAVLILCMSLTSCSKPALSDDGKCSVVCEIAEVCLEQYSEGNCEKEKDISIEQILRWSASGYLVTNRRLEATSRVKVHDRSGFDGNQIFIDSKVRDGVYKYSAGL